MRKALKTLEGQRLTFRGSFTKYGTKNGYHHTLTTVLLTHICCCDHPHLNELTDHIWLNYTKGIQQLQLEYGDILEFKATVQEYEAGYKGHRYDDDYAPEYVSPIRSDYGLKYPRNIRKIDEKDGTLPILKHSLDPPYEQTRLQRIQEWRDRQSQPIIYQSASIDITTSKSSLSTKKYKTLDGFFHRLTH